MKGKSKLPRYPPNARRLPLFMLEESVQNSTSRVTRNPGTNRPGIAAWNRKPTGIRAEIIKGFRSEGSLHRGMGHTRFG
jgi:hypothetical protein